MTQIGIKFTSPERARERLGLASAPSRLRTLADDLQYNLIFATVRAHNFREPDQLEYTPSRRMLGIAGGLDAGAVIRTAVALGLADEVWLLGQTIAEVTTPKASHSAAGALLRVGAVVVSGSMDHFAARCRHLRASVYVQQMGSSSAPSGRIQDAAIALIVGSSSTRALAHLDVRTIGLRVEDGTPTQMAAASIALHELAIALQAPA